MIYDVMVIQMNKRFVIICDLCHGSMICYKVSKFANITHGLHLMSLYEMIQAHDGTGYELNISILS